MDKLNHKVPYLNKIIRNLKSIRHIRKSDLTSGMIRVIIFCWLVPYLALSVVLFYSSETKTEKQIEDTVTTSMENAAEICRVKLNEAIEESKQATYDGVIKESYEKFMQDNDENAMYQVVSKYLNDTYKYSSMISTTMLLYNRKMDREYFTYSNVAGATYASIGNFKLNSMPTVRAVARNLDTGTEFVYSAGHLYLVRNIMTSNYVPFSILVMEINVDNVFKGMSNVVWRQDGLLYLEQDLIRETQVMSDEEELELIQYARGLKLDELNLFQDEIIATYDPVSIIANLSMDVNGQRISCITKLDKVGILNEKNTVIYTYVIIVILLIPLFCATFYYFYNNISKPISDLMFASEKIEDGEYGYKIQKFDRNEEFGKLVETFNHMSVSLEESFNRIYAEEIAVRDANMQALQAQINPHFLNNTLEIINWKARMSGNRDVSGMIESLGIMMEATMNRRNESFITIREELKYVDAYLYIIVHRFGSKFQFEKEVDENLMNLKIPRLIIQPIVENMVEHGGDVYGNRIGKLKIFDDSGNLHIVVENNGNVSDKDKERIEKLLKATKMEENMHNIGIRNVNLRIKMLYGEQSGLTIVNKEENLTVSEIIIEKKKLEQ